MEPEYPAWEKVKWPLGPICPACNSEKPYRINRASSKSVLYRCKVCSEFFSLFRDTVFRARKKPLFWYENILRSLIEGCSIFSISGSDFAHNRGTWCAATNIINALPVSEGCCHRQPQFASVRPIQKISACAECGQLMHWRDYEWRFFRAFVSLPVEKDAIFRKVLECCLRPQCRA